MVSWNILILVVVQLFWWALFVLLPLWWVRRELRASVKRALDLALRHDELFGVHIHLVHSPIRERLEKLERDR